MCIRDRLQSGEWWLQHDTAPAHTSHAVQHFFAKHNTPQLQHSLYSPDMIPCDFFLFLKIKIQLKERSFQDIEGTKQNAMKELEALTENNFKTCFEQLEKHWKQCVACLLYTSRCV